jgi:PAS domain S-box-containing protein
MASALRNAVQDTIDEASRNAQAFLARLSASPKSEAPNIDEFASCLRALLVRTESIEAERLSLLQQQAALRTVISSVPHFVFWKDSDCVYRGCNDIFASLGGLKSPEEIVGKTDYDMPWTKEQSDLYREDDLRVIRDGKPILDIEETNLDADGNEKVILTSKVPLQAEDGTIIGMLGIFADISARKRMEKDLQRSKELAEAADRAKSDFLAAMSHELRTPLTLILSPLESLFAERRDELSAPIAELLERLYRNAYRLKILTDDILDFSKHQAGHLQLNVVPLEVSGHVSRLVLDMTPAASAGRIVLRSDGIADSLGTVMVDVGKLDKILVNLIGNALKFTPAGGEVRVSARREDDRLVFAVADSGIGIDPSDHERLFRRFEQVDGGSKRRQGGTGLGLSLVKGFVELMGGSVRVDSRLGQGATFTVTLPYEVAEGKARPLPHVDPRSAGALFTRERTRPHRDAPRDSAEAAVTPADAPRVVVAEDSDELREYIAHVLGSEFRVTAVADGQAAYEVIQREKPDVVVSDIMMPVMDGFELVAKMKAHPALALIPVLLLTARAGVEASAASLNRGADDYLSKPFSPVDLVSRVRAAHRMTRLHSDLLEAERRAAISERLASLGRLLAKLAHELNNPINVVYNGLAPIEEYSRSLIAYAEACDKLVDPGGGDHPLAALRETLEYDFVLRDLPCALTEVRDAARRVKDVQSDLRLFLGGRTALKRSRADLDELVASSLALTQRGLEDGAKAELVLGGVPAFAFDRGRLSQVLLNLLKNAWEAAGSHGRVAVETWAADGVARISVRDDGPGVPAEIRGRIFEAFFTTKELGTGTGLGLAISAEIVAQHGGHIYLDTHVDRGARFVVELPMAGTVDEGDAGTSPALGRGTLSPPSPESQVTT